MGTAMVAMRGHPTATVGRNRRPSSFGSMKGRSTMSRCERGFRWVRRCLTRYLRRASRYARVPARMRWYVDSTLTPRSEPYLSRRPAPSRILTTTTSLGTTTRMEETTDYTIRNTTKLLAEALRDMPPAAKYMADRHTVYGTDGDFIEVGYKPLVQRAAEILRKRNGWTRADAVEMAFDSLLYGGNDRRWERVGEVALIKAEGLARAYCKRREDG